MRIRKRQPVVVSETSPSSSHLARPLSTIAHEGQGLFVAQNGCWPRDHLQEVIKKEFAKQDASPLTKFVDYSQFKRYQVLKEEARSVDNVQARTMLPRNEGTGRQIGRRTSDDTHKLEVKTNDEHQKQYGSVEIVEDAARVGGNLDTIRFPNAEIEVPGGDRHPDVEKDLNHPSNKPKDSLLYSLYRVFSQLSGKTVLTAREALSKIIEDGLPGLDEGTGLPSVQVAKAIRSNPYFVHLEGGKFLLCSGPSPQNKVEVVNGFGLANVAVDPTPSQQPSTVANRLGKRDKDEETEDYSGLRNKRGRSKSSIEMREKTESDLGRKSTKTGASKSQINASPKIAQVDDIAVQICKRYDGRGWKCHEKALQGYSMCRHHHELIVNRLARLRNNGRLGSKKSLKRRRSGEKPVTEGFCETDLESNKEQAGVQWRKNVKARSLKSFNS